METSQSPPPRGRFFLGSDWVFIFLQPNRKNTSFYLLQKAGPKEWPICGFPYLLFFAESWSGGGVCFSLGSGEKAFKKKKNPPIGRVIGGGLSDLRPVPTHPKMCPSGLPRLPSL
jgi:hypothetical protein